MNNVLLVALGGALGSVSRYLVNKQFTWKDFPLSTLSVNILGSLLLGFLISKIVQQYNGEHSMYLIFGVGFCGSFTTFSTFSAEIVQFLRNGQASLAFGYLFGSIILGCLAVALGFYLGK